MKLTTYIKHTGILLAGITFFYGCDDYLDAEPRKGNGIQLETVEQLEQILSGRYADNQPYWDMNYAQAIMSDCYELTPKMCDDGFETGAYDYTAIYLNAFQPQYSDNLSTVFTEWNWGFKNINTANLIFDYVDQLTGTEEQRVLLKKKAALIRAYNYFELAGCYCVPYSEANKGELGLPLLSTSGYTTDYKRKTLEETYNFIEKDLEHALQLTLPLFEDGERKAWKENGGAANALASRFYLAKGDYKKAQYYAEEALKYADDIANYTDEAVVIRTTANDEMGFYEVPAPSWYTGSKFASDKKFEAKADRSYYRKEMTVSMSWALPSKKFLESFNQEYDMRYRLFYMEDYLPLALAGYGGYYLMMGFFLDTMPGYSYFCGDVFCSGPNVAEMMLTKAECMARQGEWNDALTYVNTKFRPNRIAAEAPASVMNLTAASQEEAIALILKERMLEFPYTVRWHDIRRCNFNADPNDDVTITRKFYEIDPTGDHGPLYGDIVTYTLSPTSNKYTYTLAVPATEIATTNGDIEQNRY